MFKAQFSLNGSLTAVQESTGAAYGRPLRSEILSQQLFAAPQQPYTAALLAAIPHFEAGGPGYSEAPPSIASSAPVM